MFKPLPVAIGLRYLRAKRRNGFISFISMASILGIALGVTVLITTLAVMGGFQREIRDRMLQMVAHATVSADGAAMPNWRIAAMLSAVFESAISRKLSVALDPKMSSPSFAWRIEAISWRRITASKASAALRRPPSPPPEEPGGDAAGAGADA